jgi:hypothetical protein
VPARRGSRFALEVAFLVALAIGLAVAEERAAVIAGVMALGWVLVALAEWALWREEPHYASGLPPRWYVPRVNLPPAQPLDPVVSGYPEGRRDEAPTWIAPADLRREVLGDWPIAAVVPDEEEPPVVEGAVVEARIVESVEEDAWTIVEMPPEPLAPPEPAAVEPEPEPVPVAAPDPVSAPEPQAEAAPDPEPHAEAAPEPEPQPEGAPEPAPEPARADLDVELARSAAGLARYSLDPLAEEPRRRFGRRREEVVTIQVPARPDGPRVLPGAGGEEG